MPRLYVTNRDGETQDVEVENSQTLMEALRDEDFEIEALCGGCCSCATCHVYIDPEFSDRVPPMSEDEDFLLEGAMHRKAETSRLSCQIRVTEQMDGLKLAIAPEE